MKCALLSNINVNILGKLLEEKFDIFIPDGYGMWENVLLSNNSLLENFMPNYIVILIDGNELIGDISDLDRIENLINDKISIIDNYAKNNKNVKILLSDIMVNKFLIGDIEKIITNKEIELLWLNKIIELVRKNNNINIISINDLVKKVGESKFFSKNLWYAGKIKYSNTADKLIIDEIDRLLSVYTKKRKKCIVLDLDNTLWGGVIGEDGIGNINLGKEGKGLIYTNVQKLFKEIKNTGILLAICSKNNYSDVEEIFNKPEMVLNKEDFIKMKINWNNKSDNIIEIAKDLNIGLDSIVFIDDSDFEVSQVKGSLPEVKVLQVPKNITNYEDLIIQLYNDYFAIIKLQKEDINKTNLYQNIKKREKALEKSINFEDFLKNLHIKICMNKLHEDDFSRALQLVNKTNQFNLTTKRYSENELMFMWTSSEYDIFIGRVEDKFGDSGKTILVILKYENNIAYIDTFIMSCRIMGRNIEDIVISFIHRYCKSKGYKKIIGIYKPTNKNTPTKGLYIRLGFKLDEKYPDDSCYYSILPETKNTICNGFGEVIYNDN